MPENREYRNDDGSVMTEQQRLDAAMEHHQGQLESGQHNKSFLDDVGNWFSGGNGQLVEYNVRGNTGEIDQSAYDLSGYDQNRALIAEQRQRAGRMSQVGQMLQARALGMGGPSAAQLQMQQGLSQATAQARAGAAGVTNPALAQRLAARSGADMSRQAFTQGGILRAQEQIKAQEATLLEEDRMAQRIQAYLKMNMTLDEAKTRAEIDRQRDLQQREQFIVSLTNQQRMAEAGYEFQDTAARRNAVATGVAAGLDYMKGDGDGG